MRCRLFVLLACFPGPGMAAPAASPVALSDLVAPFTIEEPGIYADGGSLTGFLVDSDGRRLQFCFDGRMCEDEEPRCGFLRHVYLGGHPSERRARALPIWGEEERELLSILVQATIVDTFSRDSTGVERYLASMESRGFKTVGMSRRQREDLFLHNSRAVSSAIRERLAANEAIESGVTGAPDAALGYFRLSRPVHVEQITRSWRYFEVTIADTTRRLARLRIGRQVGGPSAMLVNGEWERGEEGKTIDRWVLSLTWLALQDDGRGPGAGIPESSLRRLKREVQSRMARIITVDRRGR